MLVIDESRQRSDDSGKIARAVYWVDVHVANDGVGVRLRLSSQGRTKGAGRQVELDARRSSYSSGA